VDERDVQTVMKMLARIEDNTKEILELLREDDDEEEAEEDA
jgi:2-hydroxy-3-keto-5-methylthiopentenyl-1-phosphate phosphatase